MTAVFPPAFTWGAATSAYQIEGSTRADARGESIWDRFCRTPGAVAGGDHGDVACDHYVRWRDDLALMSELGLRAYRFSIAWPRVIPTGRGAVNARGLDFYDRLVDGLLAHGIAPVATLYHWDLPQVLEDAGGWPVRATAEAFVEYADVVTRRLGDRVGQWITHNEPWCVAVLGYQTGEHAPGRREPAAALAASHHLLLSHGWAVPVIRRNAPGAQVGITLNLVPAMPASPSAYDHDAFRRFDGTMNRWYLDPLNGRGYPADVLAEHVAAGAIPATGWRVVEPGDLATIATRCDFLGVNYYSRAVNRSSAPDNLPQTVHVAPPSEHTDIGWEVFPDGLAEVLLRVHLDYRPGPLYVTENGASYGTAPDADGRVRDVARTRYLHDHLLVARRAILAGVPLAGYFAWSLLDNFEWAYGYRQRFGITWVDYTTQARILKDSGRWYQRVIDGNAVVPLDASG
ncbi:MAG TPA: GH1 family beta-glucosidase [Kofleriaceae bacterium]|nr:GH1 family beta-glucosidase [Kofleriaceae bacterium]